MNNKFVASAIIVLAISILISGVLITGAIYDLSSQERLALEETKSVLMTNEEAAEYLGIDNVDFNDRLVDDISIKKNLHSYNVYRFIPYIEINGIKYFTKDELNKWVEYNMD